MGSWLHTGSCLPVRTVWRKTELCRCVEVLHVAKLTLHEEGAKCGYVVWKAVIASR